MDGDIFKDSDSPAVAIDDKLETVEAPQEDDDNALFNVYAGVADADPTQAANLLTLSAKTGHSPQDIYGNEAAVSKIAAAPTREQFKEISKRHPEVGSFLSDPQNMAVAYDDTDTLSAHSSAVQEYGALETMWRSLNVGTSRMSASLARVPGLAYDIAALPQNLLVKAVGRPDLQVRASDNAIAKYYDKQAEAFTVPELSESITELFRKKDYTKMGRALAAQFVANAPNQAAIIAGALSGFGTATLIGAGALAGASANKNSKDSGADPATSTINAVAHGTIEAGFERLGTFGILSHWEGQIAKNFGKATAREIMEDFSKTMLASGAGEFNEEMLTSQAQDLTDYLTGVNPDALEGMMTRSLDAGIIGGLSGVAMTAPAAIGAGRARGRAALKAQQDAEFYKAMGTSAEASKLRERLPESHRQLMNSLTSGSPVEFVHIPIEKFDGHFGVEALQQAESLGAAESYAAAKGADNGVQSIDPEGVVFVKVPMAAWVDKMVGTPTYDALAGDAKFDLNEGLTLNQLEEIRVEQKAVSEAQKKMVADSGELAQKAVAADPAIKQQHDDIAAAARASLEAHVPVDMLLKDKEKWLNASTKTIANHYVAEGSRREGDARQIFDAEFPKIVSDWAAQVRGESAPLQSRGEPAGSAGGDKSQGLQGAGLAQESSSDPEALKKEGPFRRVYPFDSSIGDKPFTVKTQADDLALHEALAHGGDPADPVFRKQRAMVYHDEGKAALVEYMKAQQAGKESAELKAAFDEAMYKMTVLLHGEAPVEMMPEWVKQARTDAEGGSLKQDQAMVPYNPQLADASYSKLMQTLEQKIQGKTATVEQIKALAANFKEDERKWTGFDAFMVGKSGKIDKAALIEHMRNHRLQVEERVLGEPITPDDEASMAKAEAEKKALELPDSGRIPFQNWAAGRGYSRTELANFWTDADRNAQSPLVRMFLDAHPELLREGPLADPTPDEFRAWAADEATGQPNLNSHSAQSIIDDWDHRGRHDDYQRFLEDRDRAAGILPSVHDLERRELREKVEEQYEQEIQERADELEQEERDSYMDSHSDEWRVDVEVNMREAEEIDDIEEGDVVETSPEGVEKKEFTVYFDNGGSMRYEAESEDAAREMAEDDLSGGKIEDNEDGFKLVLNGEDYNGNNVKVYDRNSPTGRRDVQTWHDSREDAEAEAERATEREMESFSEGLYNEDFGGHTAAVDEYVEQVENGDLELEGYSNEEGTGRKKAPKKEFKWDKARYESSYVLPGAEPGTVREIVFHAPQLEPYNASDRTHFGDISEGKEIGWTRTAIHRKDNGTAIRLANEFQNNRTQKGAAEGFKGEATGFDEWRKANDILKNLYDEKAAAFEAVSEKITKRYYAAIDSGAKNLTTERDYRVNDPEYEAAQEASESARANFQAHSNNKPGQGEVPDTPFKTNSYEFQFKRLLRWHIEQDFKTWQAEVKSGDDRSFIDWWKDRGMKQLAWTTGMQQAERNHRVDDVDKLVYDPAKQELSAFKNGRKVVDGAKMSPDAIAERLGGTTHAQEIAKRLLATEPAKAEAGGSKVEVIFDPVAPHEQHPYRLMINGVEDNRYSTKESAESEAEEARAKNNEHAGMHVIHDEGGIKVAGNAKFFLDLYDKKIPSFVKKFGKQWGATVGEAMIKTGEQEGELRYEGEEPGMVKLKLIGTKIAMGDDRRLKNSLNILLEGMKEGRSFSDLMAEGAKNNNANVGFKELAEEFGGKIVKDTASRYEKVHALNITPEMAQAAINEGFPLFQGPGADPHGEYTPATNTLKLNRSANATTLMHEFSHGALHHMFEFVKSGQANKKYLDHFQAVKTFLRITDDQKSLTREQHEKFARAWERYLRGEDDQTGSRRAPTKELQSVFDLYRKWFTNVYRKIKGSAIEGALTPEVKDFFDRMLATEDQIEQAAQEAGYQAGEIATLEDMDPAIEARHRTLQEKARAKAENILLKEQMEELRAEHQHTLDKERARLTEKIKPEVEDTPLYRAASDVEENRPGARKSAATLADEFLAGKLSVQEQGAFEAAAEIHGFSDGRDLAESIKADAEAGGMASSVKSRVDKAMAPFSDLKDTEKIRDAALAAIHKDQMTELLALEQEILSSMQHDKEIRAEISKRRRVNSQLAAASARERARGYLAGRPLREAAAFRAFVTAERNAAVRVSKAVAAKDWPAAAEAKGQQMLNHALATEALRNRAEINRRGKQLDRFIKRGSDMLNMPYGFISKIDAMLEMYGLKDPAEDGQEDTLRQIADKMLFDGRSAAEIANATGMVGAGEWRTETMAEFVARVSEDYFPIILPDSVMGSSDRLFQKNPNMTLGQLRDLHESVKTVSNLGKNFEVFLNGFIKDDMKTAGLKLVERVRANWGNRYGDTLAPGHARDTRLMEKLAGLKNLPDAYLNDHKTLLTIAELLDGGPDGPAHDILYRPLKMAADREQQMLDKYRDELNKIWARHFKPEELAAYKREAYKFSFVTGPDGKPRTFFKDELLFLALNWGNAGNRDRVMNGFRIVEMQATEMMSKLSRRDWETVQEIWDHLHTFWPDVVAQEMKINGFEPEGVKPTPFMVNVGSDRVEMKGGYYPIGYDFTRSLEAFRFAQEKNVLFKQYSAAAAHTDRGHTKARVDSLGRPIRLAADVLINHYDNVIHDLAFREAVIDTNRFLRQPEVRQAITEAIGQDGLKTIEDHLRSIASDQSEHIDGAEQALRWFRFKGTMSMLALRPVMLPINLGANLIQAAGEIGPRELFTAMRDFAFDPRQSKAFVDERSQLMKNRTQNRERDQFDVATKSADLPLADEIIQSIVGPAGEVILDKIGDTYKRWAFAADAIADQLVSYPMWLFKYRSVLAETGDEHKASNMADEMIIHTFGSGREVDRMEVQRGTEWKKATAMFFSFNGMMFNRWLSQSGIAQIQARTGQTGLAAQTFAKALTFTFILPAVYETLAREFFRNAPAGEDEEKKKKRMMAKALAHPFGNMWLARDIAPVIVENAMGTGRGQFQVSPMVSALQSILDVSKGGARLPEHAARAAAMSVGSPQFINTLVFNYLDWLKNGGEVAWRDFLSRRTKK